MFLCCRMLLWTAWRESHPEAVRIYRQDKRRNRPEAKSIKRPQR